MTENEDGKLLVEQSLHWLHILLVPDTVLKGAWTAWTVSLYLEHPKMHRVQWSMYLGMKEDITIFFILQYATGKTIF